MAIFTESFCKEIVIESLFKENPETKYKFHGKPVRSGRNGKIDDKVEIGLKVLEKNYDKIIDFSADKIWSKAKKEAKDNPKCLGAVFLQRAQSIKNLKKHLEVFSVRYEGQGESKTHPCGNMYMFLKNTILNTYFVDSPFIQVDNKYNIKMTMYGGM